MSWGTVNIEFPGALRKIITLGKKDDAIAPEEGTSSSTTADNGSASIPTPAPAEITVTESSSSSFTSATALPFASYPSPPPHLRYLELKWKHGAHHQQEEMAKKVEQLLLALEDKEESLSHLVVRILLLVSHAKALWEENFRSKKYEEARVYFMRLESVVRQIRILFDSVRRLQLTSADRLGIVALGGYRSLLRVMEEPLRAAYEFLTHYMGITHALVVEHFRVQDMTSSSDVEDTETSLPSDAASGQDMISTYFPSFLEKCSFIHMEAKLGELRDSMATTASLLDVLVQGLTVVSVLPSSADDGPYEEVGVMDSLLPESVPWRHDLQPCHLGYEYNKELSSYVRQLNVFFAATGKSYAMGNFVTRQTMFSSHMLKYALSPKEASRQAIEFKRSINLDMLRSVWDVLEDPMYHWFAVSLGYSTNQKVFVDRFVEIDYPHSSSDDDHPTPPPPKIKARFIWDPPSSLRPSSPSYFASLSAYFSFLSAPSLPSFVTPSHWYPAYWRRDDEESEDDTTTAHAFSPTSFSPTSASFYSPPRTPVAMPQSVYSPPISTSASTAATSASASSSSSSFHVFSPSSYRSLFPTLWKRDDEEKEHQPPAYVPAGDYHNEFLEEDAVHHAEQAERGQHDDDHHHHHQQQHTNGGEKDEQRNSNRGGKEEEAKAEQGGEGPCLVFHVHGGGFVSQSSQSHISYLKQWAGLTGIPILTVDYSLSPEYPYPTAHNQCYAAYKWVLSNYRELGIANDSKAPLRVVVVGDSAGGNLVTGLTIRAIAEGIAPPVGVVLAYPALRLSLAASISRTVFNHDPVLNFPSTALCLNSYVPEDKRSTAFMDPYISPNMAPSSLLAKFPPTHVAAGGLDPLLDDAVYFVHRLQKEQRPVELRIYDSLPHGFMNVSQTIPSSKLAIVDIASAITQLMFAPTAD